MSCNIYPVTALAWRMQTLFIRDKWKPSWHNYGRNNNSSVWVAPWLIILQGGGGRGDSVVLGLTRPSLRGFPLALVRQILLSTSPLTIFIHKHLAPKERHQTKNTTRGQHHLCAMLTSALMKLIHISSVQPSGVQQRRGRRSRGSVHVCAFLLCVCVSSHFVLRLPVDPGPLHGGLVLIPFAERRWKWMLSELIGMTKGGHMVVCVLVYGDGSHHIPLRRVARCFMNEPTESWQIVHKPTDRLVALLPSRGGGGWGLVGVCLCGSVSKLSNTSPHPDACKNKLLEVMSLLYILLIRTPPFSLKAPQRGWNKDNLM